MRDFSKEILPARVGLVYARKHCLKLLPHRWHDWIQWRELSKHERAIVERDFNTSRLNDIQLSIRETNSIHQNDRIFRLEVTVYIYQNLRNWIIYQQTRWVCYNLTYSSGSTIRIRFNATKNTVTKKLTSMALFIMCESIVLSKNWVNWKLQTNLITILKRWKDIILNINFHIIIAAVSVI